MRSYFYPGELPGDVSEHWPDPTDVATFKDADEAFRKLLLSCRRVGVSGWFQFGMSRNFRIVGSALYQNKDHQAFPGEVNLEG